MVTKPQDKQENMTTPEVEKLTEEQVDAAIEAQLTLAKTAFAEAERIAQEAGVTFSFEIGDGYGTYYGRNGYWDGWQGSSC